MFDPGPRIRTPPAASVLTWSDTADDLLLVGQRLTIVGPAESAD